MSGTVAKGFVGCCRPETVHLEICTALQSQLIIHELLLHFVELQRFHSTLKGGKENPTDYRFQLYLKES